MSGAAARGPRAPDARGVHRDDARLEGGLGLRRARRLARERPHRRDARGRPHGRRVRREEDARLRARLPAHEPRRAVPVLAPPRRAARGAGPRALGATLKLFQRAWCLARGIRLVTWMYDPFLLKNARLNLGRLRATGPRVPPELLRAHRAASTPASRRTASRSTGGSTRPASSRAAAGERAAERPDVAGAARRDEPARAPGGPARPPPVPGGRAAHLPDRPRARTRPARRRFGALATALFARGYEVTDVVAFADGAPAYVLDRRAVIGFFEKENRHEEDLFACSFPPPSSSSPTAALALDDFQVTGEVKEKTADTITVMKGKERFQIGIDKDTKGAPTSRSATRSRSSTRCTARRSR